MNDVVVYPAVRCPFDADAVVIVAGGDVVADDLAVSDNASLRTENDDSFHPVLHVDDETVPDDVVAAASDPESTSAEAIQLTAITTVLLSMYLDSVSVSWILGVRSDSVGASCLCRNELRKTSATKHICGGDEPKYAKKSSLCGLSAR